MIYNILRWLACVCGLGIATTVSAAVTATYGASSATAAFVTIEKSPNQAGVQAGQVKARIKVSGQLTASGLSMQARARFSVSPAPNVNGSFLGTFQSYVGDGQPSLSFEDHFDVVGTAGLVTTLKVEVEIIQGGYVQYAHKVEWVEIAFQWSPQIVSVSLPSDIEAGESITGQATGAQGGNAYNISVVSGDINAAINSATGQITIMAGQTKGPWEVQVWASAGNGYLRSDYVSAGGLVINAKRNKVTLTFDNRDSSVATEFRVYQDGVVVATRLIPGGSVSAQTIEVPTSSPVTVKSVSRGLTTDGTIWVPTVDDFEMEHEAGTFTPDKVPDSDTPPPKGTVKANSPDPKPQPDSEKNVWSSKPTEELLTGKTYAEGVDKITKAIKDLGPKTNPTLEPVQIDDLSGSATTAKLASMLPAVPGVSIGGPVSSIGVSLRMPRIEQPFVVEFDAAPYEGQISIFKMIFRSAMAFGFFLLYVSTIRKAFAN